MFRVACGGAKNTSTKAHLSNAKEPCSLLLVPKKPQAVIGFRAEPALVKQLEKAAEQQERPVSWVIRKLLLQALAQNEKTA